VNGRDWTNDAAIVSRKEQIRVDASTRTEEAIMSDRPEEYKDDVEPDVDDFGDRVVYVDGKSSFLMEGDPDVNDPKYAGRALPQLLRDGWSIKMIGVDHVVLTGMESPEPSPIPKQEPLTYTPSPRLGGGNRGRGGGRGFG
jgi:hypothetical protein